MVRRFVHKDYEDLASWYAAHNKPVPKLEDLPNYGLIEPNIGAGFLILTDANIGFIEYYISNPDSTKEERDLALDAITDGLIEYGRKFGLKYFKCDTQLPSIESRALKHNFKYIGEFKTYFLGGL